MIVLYRQLPDLFVKALNLYSSVIANCCDTTSMNCDINNSKILWVFLTPRTRVDIKHDSQYGSFFVGKCYRRWAYKVEN